jgi:O-antigen/teichoic acid export membrane protein
MTEVLTVQRPDSPSGSDGNDSVDNPDSLDSAVLADGARQTMGTVATRAASLLFGMAASVVLAHTLQPAGRGAYHVITTVAGTATILGHLSVGQAQTALWADPRRRRAVIANSLPLGLAVGSLAALVAWCVTLVAHSALRLAHPDLVGLALVGVPAGISLLYLTNIAALTGRMGLANRAALTGAVLQCGSLITLGFVGLLTVRAVVALWMVSMVVSCTVLAVAERPGLRRFRPRVSPRTPAPGISPHLGPVTGFLLLRADVFILAAQASAQAVGVYSLAVSIMEMSNIAADSLSQVALSRQIRESDSESAAVTARITRLTVLVALASALVVVLSAPVVVPTLYGEAFAGAVPMLLMLAPGVVALTATRPVYAFLVRTGSSRLVVVPCVIALAVNVVINVLLIPVLGAEGCCVASSVGYIALAGLQTWLFLRRSGLAPGELLPGGQDVRSLTSAVRSVLRWFPAPTCGEPTG